MNSIFRCISFQLCCVIFTFKVKWLHLHDTIQDVLVQLATLCLCKVRICYILKFAEIGQYWPVLLGLFSNHAKTYFQIGELSLVDNDNFEGTVRAIIYFLYLLRQVNLWGDRESSIMIVPNYSSSPTSILLSSFLMSNKESINR